MNRAFSLIELLVVIAIIGLLAALAMPSVAGILGGSKVSMGVETVNGALSSARQLAATKNREIEFRLIEMSDPTFPGSASQIRAAFSVISIAANTASAVRPSVITPWLASRMTRGGR